MKKIFGIVHSLLCDDIDSDVLKEKQYLESSDNDN